jgi:hypothetical protein
MCTATGEAAAIKEEGTCIESNNASLSVAELASVSEKAGDGLCNVPLDPQQRVATQVQAKLDGVAAGDLRSHWEIVNPSSVFKTPVCKPHVRLGIKCPVPLEFEISEMSAVADKESRARKEGQGCKDIITHKQDLEEALTSSTSMISGSDRLVSVLKSSAENTVTHAVPSLVSLFAVVRTGRAARNDSAPALGTLALSSKKLVTERVRSSAATATMESVVVPQSTEAGAAALEQASEIGSGGLEVMSDTKLCADRAEISRTFKTSATSSSVDPASIVQFSMRGSRLPLPPHSVCLQAKSRLFALVSAIIRTCTISYLAKTLVGERTPYQGWAREGIGTKRWRF